MKRFERFTDDEMQNLYRLMKVQYGSYAGITSLFSEVVLEMWCRGLLVEKTTSPMWTVTAAGTPVLKTT